MGISFVVFMVVRITNSFVFYFAFLISHFALKLLSLQMN